MHATPVTPQARNANLHHPAPPQSHHNQNSPTSPLLSGNYDPQQAPPHVPHPNSAQHGPFLAAPNPPRAPAPRVQQPAARPRARRLFFLFHLTLHTIPPLRSLHAPHHTHHAHHAQLHPQATNQLHVFERLGLVLLANFSVNVNGSHVLTRPVFVPVFVWLLVEIHSGLELPKGWGGGARKHWMHHQGGEGV